MEKASLYIFDCDGVLVDSEILAVRAYVKAYARHGLTISKDDVARCFGMKQADIFEAIGKDTGAAYPVAHSQDLSEEIRTLLKAELVATKGIAALLDSLETRRCVASSSAPDRIALSLSLTGLEHHFGANVFSSTMVKNGKPAPDLFLYAAAVMGVDPAACAVFEDSVYGIRAARSAGMRAFGYAGGSHVTASHAERLLQAGAHRVFGSWDEVQYTLAS